MSPAPRNGDAASQDFTAALLPPDIRAESILQDCLLDYDSLRLSLVAGLFLAQCLHLLPNIMDVVAFT